VRYQLVQHLRLLVVERKLEREVSSCAAEGFG
jgi:hypothetical protein